MDENRFVKIKGSGSFLPGSPIPFTDIFKHLGELNEAPEKIKKWVARMKPLMNELLDIEFCHYAIDPVTREFTDDNISMSVKAAKLALDRAGVKAEDVEFIAYGSAHMDQMPTASARIQDALGIEKCAEIGVHANCTSAYKALSVAADLIKLGRFNNALVISSSISSSELIAEYYNQAIVKKEELFLRNFLCDGAGALYLEKCDKKENGFFVEETYFESIGGKKPSVMYNGRPARWMNPKEEYEKGLHHLTQKFQEQLRLHFNEPDGTVFYKGLKRMIEKYKIDLTKVKYFQVNLPSKHISEMVMEECEALGIKKETLWTKMSKMGYSGPPMVFICLDKIIREEKLAKNDLILSFVTEVSKFMQAGYLLKYC